MAFCHQYNMTILYAYVDQMLIGPYQFWPGHTLALCPRPGPANTTKTFRACRKVLCCLCVAQLCIKPHWRAFETFT